MRIGIDLGGTKISGIVLDDEAQTLAYERVATPTDDYQSILQTVTDLVATLEKQVGTTMPVGVGTPGALSPATGLLRNSNSVCLNGMPLKQDLETCLKRTIKLANDADCFALSEATDGAAQGAASVFGVIIGTGVGGGLVLQRQLVQGVNAIAGEWGHNPLPWMTPHESPGLPCYCGKQGCIETFLAGPALEKHHAKYSGEDITTYEIVARSTEHAAARESLTRYVDRVARALAGVINIIDPEVIVLGGGMSNVSRLYQEVPDRWHRYVFSDVVNTRLVKNQYGDDSGVRGAAWL